MIVFSCVSIPLLLEISPIGGHVADANFPPLSLSHPLGTDHNGNDVLARMLHGGRISLSIAFLVTICSLCLGLAIGILAGLTGRWLDALLSRSLDILVAFPSLVLVLAFAHAFGSGIYQTVVALTIVSIPAYARIARGAAIKLRSLPFMFSAELAGSSKFRIAVWHAIPNILPQLSSYALLRAGGVILLEGALSYLGLGVPAPNPSWGNMIAESQLEMLSRPWLVLLPAGILFFTVLSLNLLGDAARQRWNSR
jgi:peptide/nickel transport system permease protein